MNWESLFRRGSYRTVIRTLATSRLLAPVRNAGLRVLESKICEFFVEQNPYNRPRQVQRDKADCLIALFHCALRSLQKGNISREVLDRVLDSFVGNVLCGREALHAAERRLGFEPPGFLVISPTKRCNLRCTGCYAASDATARSSIDRQTFERILDEKERLWGSHFTVISGGEPFLWKDDGCDLIEIAARHPAQFFLVYTNGTLIDKERARRLAEVGNLSPAISVEGFEEETDARRGKGVHKKILKAFENLRQVGVPFGISITATCHNWDLVTSERFHDYYFLEQGATYAWLFQYMPIGRKHTLDLMVTAQQRLEMWHRMWDLVRRKKYFIVDFWNSGTASSGCIAFGRGGGYLYIDWDGDVTPCVFVPYAAANIHETYASGGNLDTLLEVPFFKEGRQWQDRYGYNQPAERVHNWLCPCVYRDHYEVFLEAARAHDPKPIDEGAAQALADPAYHRGMREYGETYRRLAAPLWAERYAEANKAASAAAKDAGG